MNDQKRAKKKRNEFYCLLACLIFFILYVLKIIRIYELSKVVGKVL